MSDSRPQPSIVALDLVLARLAVAVEALERALDAGQAAPLDAIAGAASTPTPIVPFALPPPPPPLDGIPDDPTPQPQPWPGYAMRREPRASDAEPRSRLRRLERLPFVGGLFAALAASLEAPGRIARLEQRLQMESAQAEQGLAAMHDALRDAFTAIEARRVEEASRVRDGFARVGAAHGSVSAYLRVLAEQVAAREAMHAEAAQQAAVLAARFATLEEAVRRQETLRQAVGGLRPLAEALSVLRGAVAALESALRAPPPPALPALPAEPVRALDPALDAYYLSFENRFRGSREDITARMRAFLPDAQAAAAAAPGLPIVDLGPGRGEWLEVLREATIPATGVDTNAAMLEEIRARGLAAQEGDALAYLRALPAASLAAVTGFHVVEHLPFADLAALFREAFRAIHPGGLLVFETPNPENLIVGACTFWYDPTHVRPLPPPVLLFMAQQAGFERAEVRRLHPDPDAVPLSDNPTPLDARVHALLHGPRDYAVVAWRP